MVWSVEGNSLKFQKRSLKPRKLLIKIFLGRDSSSMWSVTIFTEQQSFNVLKGFLLCRQPGVWSGFFPVLHRRARWYTNGWPAPNVSGFLAQWDRASHWCREVAGQTPLKRCIFSGFYIRNCINCVHNCEDHSLLDTLLETPRTGIFLGLNLTLLSRAWSKTSFRVPSYLISSFPVITRSVKSHVHPQCLK